MKFISTYFKIDVNISYKFQLDPLLPFPGDLVATSNLLLQAGLMDSRELVGGMRQAYDTAVNIQLLLANNPDNAATHFALFHHYGKIDFACDEVVSRCNGVLAAF